MSESVFAIHREIVTELEIRYDLEPSNEENYMYSREGRFIRRNNDFIDKLKPKVTADQIQRMSEAQDLQKSFSFLPQDDSFLDLPRTRPPTHEYPKRSHSPSTPPNGRTPRIGLSGDKVSPPLHSIRGRERSYSSPTLLSKDKM